MNKASGAKWPWFERQFDFNFPVAKMPEILERLRGTEIRLEHLANSVNGDWSWREQPGTWSAQENAGHLVDLEPLWLNRVHDILSGAETMTEADLTNQKTHTANHHEVPLQEILVRFRTARRELVAAIEAAGIDAWSQAARHPRLGTPMRLVDHAFFVAEHDDYHLARIRHLLIAGGSK